MEREMVPLREMMDRLLESAFTPAFWEWGPRPSGVGRGLLQMDVTEDEQNYYVHALLPGADPNTLNVSVQDNMVTIRGETKPWWHQEGQRWLCQEIGHGRFERQFTLAAPVDADRAEARYRDGIVEIKLPKAETVRTKTIKVRTET